MAGEPGLDVEGEGDGDADVLDAACAVCVGKGVGADAPGPGAVGASAGATTGPRRAAGPTSADRFDAAWDTGWFTAPVAGR